MKRRTNVFITLSLLLVLFLYGGFEKVTALAPKNADGTLINTEIQQTDDAELLYKKIIDSVDIVEDNIGKYNYPVRPGMEEWASLKTTASIHLALQIPEKILHDMSTRDLVDTVLDYPILTTELLSFADKTNPFRVIEHLEKTFNGLFELLQREDVGTELLINYKETDIGSVIQLFDTDPLESIEIISQIKFTELLLAHKLVQSKLTDKEVIILNDLIIKNLEIKKIREGLFGLSISTYDEAIKYNINISNSHVVEPQYAYYVTTPRGNPVGVMVNDEFSSDAIVWYDFCYKRDWPGAAFISSSSAKYNCHSYAWYQPSRYNPYWMPNPSTYMSDGSYTSRLLSSVQTYDRFYYAPVIDHTAVVTSVNGTSFSQIILTSKWSEGPLMQHTAEYGPYDETVSSPTIWR